MRSQTTDEKSKKVLINNCFESNNLALLYLAKNVERETWKVSKKEPSASALSWV